MTYKLQEPRNANYVYIDVEGNLQFIVPLIGGNSIGTDNTCQSTAALKEFLGASGGAVRSNALDELRRYQTALTYDIEFLTTLNFSDHQNLIIKKQTRFRQVNELIAALTIIKNSSEFSGLNTLFSNFPPTIKQFFSQKSNIHSIQLRPMVMDTYLRCTDASVFKIERAAVSSFQAGLLTAYNDGITFSSPKALLKAAVLEAISGRNNLQFADILATVNAQSTRLFSPSVIDFSRDRNNNPMGTCIQIALGLDTNYHDSDPNAEPLSSEEFVDAILAAGDTTALDRAQVSGELYTQSPFSISFEHQPEVANRLSIITQFFFAKVNVYCYSNELSTTDFGRVLDALTPEAVTSIAELVKNALRDKQSVEDRLFAWINNNPARFGLSQTLSNIEIDIIKNEFTRQYREIAGHQHKDEYLFLDHSKTGDFVNHQDSICIPFTRLVANMSFIPNRAFFAEQLPSVNVLPTKLVALPNVASLPNEVDFQSEAVDRHINWALENIDRAVIFLVSMINNGTQRLFEVLTNEQINQFAAHRNWPQIQARLPALVGEQTVLQSINNKFSAATPAYHIRLNSANLRAIKATYIEFLVNTEYPDGTSVSVDTPADIKQVLNSLLEGYVSEVRPHDQGGVVVRCINSTAERQIQAIVSAPENTNKLYISNNTAVCIYQEVHDQYGENSEEYRNMQRLRNNSNSPQYTEASRLLTEKQIEVTGNVDDDYQRIAEIYGQNSPEYQRMMALSNRDLPAKFREACRLLHLTNYDEIGFPGTIGINGYIVRANEATLATIEMICRRQSMIRITREQENQLYKRVPAQYQDELNQMSNRVLPCKIGCTLELLGIPFDGLVFNQGGGFLLRSSPDTDRRIRHLCAQPVGGAQVQTNSNANEIIRRNLIESMRFTQTVTIEKVRAMTNMPPALSPALLNKPVLLNCPDSILHAFQNVIRQSSGRILGAQFMNPYTQHVECFPEDASQFTSRHLQILARCEHMNTTGKINIALYNNALTDNEIATIRCLVKNTTVVGVTEAVAYGGFPGNSRPNPFAIPQKTIIVDQSGLQWQADHRNTGGLFFYPTDPARVNADWQNTTYLAMYGQERGACSSNSLDVVWNQVPGKVDLDKVANAIRIEFRQAFDAARMAGEVILTEGEQINFKFLKAGMGFFAEGIGVNNSLVLKARLNGIKLALEDIHAEKQQVGAIAIGVSNPILGKIKRIELPFSSRDGNLDEIRTLVNSIGLEWGGAPNEDVFSPHPTYVNACTNCADPHAMIGNEGGRSSVDANMATNANVCHLNVANNPRAVCVPAIDVNKRDSNNVVATHHRVLDLLMQPSRVSNIQPDIAQVANAAADQVPLIGNRGNRERLFRLSQFDQILAAHQQRAEQTARAAEQQLRSKFQRVYAAIVALDSYGKELKDSTYEDKIQAGNLAIVLSQELMNDLEADEGNHSHGSNSQFINKLKDGYQKMSQHRDLSILHRILRAIASAYKAFISCFTQTDSNCLENVEIGAISHGFFNLTKRQELVCLINEAYTQEVNNVNVT